LPEKFQEVLFRRSPANYEDAIHLRKLFLERLHMLGRALEVQFALDGDRKSGNPLLSSNAGLPVVSNLNLCWDVERACVPDHVVSIIEVRPSPAIT